MQIRKELIAEFLTAIGEDPKRGGLKETPTRFVRAWKHWTSGYDQDPKDILKEFKDGTENYDEMILVKNIPVYSHCEHHLTPFFGVAHIGYVPYLKIVGLSKLPRLVNIFARRLQIQERLTSQIANALVEHIRPIGVGVVLECRHLCMESRGIQQQGATTITSSIRGAIKNDSAARKEFLDLIK